jgi:hypothetical protein
MRKAITKASLSDHVALLECPPMCMADTNGFLLIQKKDSQEYAMLAFSRDGTYWCYHPVGEFTHEMYWYKNSGTMLMRIRGEQPNNNTYKSYNKFYKEMMEMFT